MSAESLKHGEPQRYYVLRFENDLNSQVLYLCCNGHRSRYLAKAKLFHSFQAAIKQGCESVVKSISSLPHDWKENVIILRAIPVMATIQAEQGV